jgi:hypothetical protein
MRDHREGEVNSRGNARACDSVAVEYHSGIHRFRTENGKLVV